MDKRRLIAGAFLVMAMVAVQGWTPPAGATASIGACCLGESVCQNIEPFACEQQSGTFIGSGTSCANVNCNPGVAAPVLSIVGIIGMIGALGSFGAYRLVLRKRG